MRHPPRPQVVFLNGFDLLQSVLNTTPSHLQISFPDEEDLGEKRHQFDHLPAFQHARVSGLRMIRVWLQPSAVTALSLWYTLTIKRPQSGS
jgi:hypothetical protein